MVGIGRAISGSALSAEWNNILAISSVVSEWKRVQQYLSQTEAWLLVLELQKECRRNSW